MMLVQQKILNYIIKSSMVNKLALKQNIIKKILPNTNIFKLCLTRDSKIFINDRKHLFSEGEFKVTTTLMSKFE